MKERVYVFLLMLLLAVSPAFSQAISDEEVIEYVKEATRRGDSQKKIIADLAAKGVTREQAERLKEVYNKEKTEINPSDAIEVQRNRQSIDIITEISEEDKLEEETIVIGRGSKIIFGQNIFKDKNLTFEPNQNIATPDNYKLGPGDEVIIDIWGVNQTTLSLVISPDGNVSIPNIGLVYLNGLTIKEATSYLRKKLGQIYAGISNEESDSSLKVSLGQIRTIQVNVMGEVEAPGTYSLSSLSSVFHAIYNAGGINSQGSLRYIKLMRNGSKVKEIDLYAFILRGENIGDIRLEDGDVIIIPSYKNLTNIVGNVKREMYYEIKDGETLADLIEYAGGFAADAFKKNIQITRLCDKEYKIYTVNDTDFASFNLQDGDEVYVGKILDRYENKLEIKGAVYRPGVYEYGNEIKTVKQLIAKAEGIRGDAFLGRAVMHREREDLTLEVIQVDIKGLLNGTVEDIPLKRSDVLYIPSIHDLKEFGSISVFGEVARPGDFPFAENTTLEDIIIQAGGLKESASTVKVDVSRRIKDSKDVVLTRQTGKMFSFALKDGFVVDGETAFVLQPYDQIFVRKSPSYKPQTNVKVIGEVLYAGTYSLTHRNERLSDLIKKSGGFMPDAYVKGARLTRKINDDERVKMQKTLDLMKQKSDSLDIEKLELGDVYYVGIDLEAAMKNPGSSVDLVLREGDILDIPEFNNTVRISGAVLYPNTVVYDDGKKASHYVSQAGGYGSRAKKNKMYVLHMNGTASKVKKNSKKTITPGSELIVPDRGKPRINMQNALAFATSAASLATMVATIANLTK